MAHTITAAQSYTMPKTQASY